MKQLIPAPVLSFSALFLLLSWIVLHHNSQARITDHYSHQIEISNASVIQTASEIALYIESHRRMAQLFVWSFNKSLKRLLDDPDNVLARSYINQKSKQYIPEAITFTLADEHGVVLLDDPDKVIGNGCRMDIRHFSSDRIPNELFIHSNPQIEGYHIDILASLSALEGDPQNIFLLSLATPKIQNILKKGQADGHRLFLIRTDKNSQIELTSKGLGAALEGNRNLPSEKIDKSLSKIEVGHTLWTLVDLPSENLFSSFSNDINKQKHHLFFILCLLTFLMLAVVYFGDKKRRSAEQSTILTKNKTDELNRQLKHQKDSLEQRVKERTEELSLMAHYDVLTQLPNRVLFADRFNQAIAHSKRVNSQLAICFLDLDNFKSINDTSGHDIGDQVLVEIAHRIKETIREGDSVSRQGGDEFTLLLNDIESYTQCEQLLNRIHDSIAQPCFIGEQSYKITASTGVTLFPSDDNDIDTLLRHADLAMYQAKQQGKNQHHLFNKKHDQQITERHNQLAEIRQALINKEFQLFYQPKVNMKKDEVFGAEALIRWFHPEKGMIPPLDFLPLLDGTDLEIQIGGWVINEALGQLNSWKDQGLDIEVSINVSSHHLQSPIFFDQLNDALDNYPNINSQDLQLEILESSVIGDLETVSGIIKRCQNEIGVKIALDDFGTGYSSLTHLRSLSADTIKIDQSFVRDMLEDSDDLALIESIIGLSKTFGHQIIAEGVETAEHGILLMRIGCNCAQGYGIARPMPADEIRPWIHNYKPDESWAVWSGSEWEMSNLPLVVAQSDHMKWIQEIFNALEGHGLGLDKDELTNHYECRLGSWYYSHGQKHYGHLDAFRELEPVHVNVHKTGHRIIQLLNDGMKEEAIQLSEELLTLKSVVLESLNTLQKQVNFPAKKQSNSSS